jgi:hypothetical protein
MEGVLKFMGTRVLANLSRGVWVDALRELSLCCADAEAHETHELLRRINHLLLAAPAPALLTGLRPLGPARLDALLEIDAADSAAMAMFGHGTGYLLSRSGDGACLASVILPGSQQEESGSGVTPALALVGALSLALLDAESWAPKPRARSSADACAALH